MRQGHTITENHPVISLLYLVMLALGGTITFSAIGVAVGALIYGLPENLLTGETNLTQANELGFMKILQIFSSAGLFLLPPLVLARIESKTPMQWLKFNNSLSSLLILLILVLMLSGNPVLELIVELNKAMKLPEFLRDVEAWMLAKEKQMEILTKQLLVMNDWKDLSINLLMIAVLPAISEELFFRGCVQRLFTKWVKNYHAGIWITAIIFSAIHIQFYGFFPRMFLGALFGYLLIWTGNIWYPIIAHFVNNGVTVIAAYVYQRQGKSLDEFETATQAGWPVYLGSAVILTGLLMFFRQSALKLQEKNEAGLD
ncbi:MAG TPA: CPBP family intramembrane glutamic endopeptidase [Sphingobacteriaceae bacterium]